MSRANKHSHLKRGSTVEDKDTWKLGGEFVTRLREEDSTLSKISIIGNIKLCSLFSVEASIASVRGWMYWAVSIWVVGGENVGR